MRTIIIFLVVVLVVLLCGVYLSVSEWLTATATYFGPRPNL